jgi:hypothetical protein
VTVNGTLDSASGNGVDARISNAASSRNIAVSSSGNIVTGATGIGVNAINSGLTTGGTVNVTNNGAISQTFLPLNTVGTAALSVFGTGGAVT